MTTLSRGTGLTWRAGPSSSPAHSPIPPTLRSTKEGHFHPGQALLKIPSFVPLRERCSLALTSVRPALPRPRRGQEVRQSAGSPQAPNPPLVTHSCSPEAGRFRSSTALRAVPDRPLPEQKKFYAFVRRKLLTRCRAASRPGLRCSSSSAFAATSHKILFCSLRHSPLRPSLQGEPRFARLSLWPTAIHPLSPKLSRKLLRASALLRRTSAQLSRQPRGTASPPAVATLSHGVRSMKRAAFLSAAPPFRVRGASKRKTA